ncbi:MAG: chromate resistance protein ChrB domain-containing protein [Pseudomonadota bacterium]|nr:chromate resistance protein ChrB domain-containing protein [Pseudomonadota bacterium]
MSRRITAQELASLVGSGRSPLVIDVRRREVFEQSTRRIAGAIWRDHMRAAEWSRQFARDARIVVYCVHGHNVSEIAASQLSVLGFDVALLEGGIDAYEKAGGTLVARTGPGVDPAAGPSIWVTRERPKIDRVACPWLIRRFIDPFAVFHFVSAEWVKDVAEETGATPFDIEGVPFSHEAGNCTFDRLIGQFGLDEPALVHLARIVRGADTAQFDLDPRSAGLLAISLGLSAIEPNDLRQMEQGLPVYDDHYGWCRHAVNETHTWPAKAA